MALRGRRLFRRGRRTVQLQKSSDSEKCNSKTETCICKENNCLLASENEIISEIAQIIFWCERTWVYWLSFPFSPSSFSLSRPSGHRPWPFGRRKGTEGAPITCKMQKWVSQDTQTKTCQIKWTQSGQMR